MEKLEKTFSIAKEEYLELIHKDFPGFNPDEHIDKGSHLSKEKKVKNSKNILSNLDVTGDGKVDVSDFIRMPKAIVKGSISKAKHISKKSNQALHSINPTKVVSDAKSVATKVGSSISNTELSDVTSTAGKIAKTAVGAQGIQNRNIAKSILEVCGEYYDSAEAITEKKRDELNNNIIDFGEYRLFALHRTVGPFLKYLEQLEQKNSVKEYEVLIGASIDTKTLDKIEKIDMAASEALRTTAVSGAFGAAAVLGTPSLVTGTVTAFASASTGTAISSLSGAAANNAVLAWLGGGSLATGGGGMAAGAVTLTALTAGATAVTAILAAGTMVSLHYGKKLTEAKEYEKDIGIAVANLEKAWVVMGGISQRCDELQKVTEELKWRSKDVLSELEALIPNFDFSDSKCVETFNKAALMVKTMTELAQIPLLDNDGNLSDESINISSKVRKILNTEV